MVEATTAPFGQLTHPWRRGVIRGVLFDVDGTLYRQTPLRLVMALELGAASVARPHRARQLLRGLSAYRSELEALREAAAPLEHSTHIEAAAARARLPRSLLEALVAEWMVRRPLKYLSWFSAPGLSELLAFLAQTRINCGVLSDYPAVEKLRALRLDHLFSPILCAADVGALKPSTAGYLTACHRWGLQPSEVLMVGDRVDVDAAGATAAGMSSVIIGRRPPRATVPADCVFLPTLSRLRRALTDCN